MGPVELVDKNHVLIELNVHHIKPFVCGEDGIPVGTLAINPVIPYGICGAVDKHAREADLVVRIDAVGQVAEGCGIRGVGVFIDVWEIYL